MTEREVNVDTLKKMGADNYNSASSRLITLQNRKQMLEETIAQKNQELRELCIQEAQLTNIMPPEVPLEPGETLIQFRKKVGTTFEYPPNLLNKLSNEKETIAALETEIQFQRCILEDASRFANDASNHKEKRKNTLIFEQTKHRVKELEDRLQTLKIQQYGPEAINNQLKHKKKPRPPFKFDMASLRNNNFGSHSEEVNKAYLHNYQYQENHVENRFTNPMMPVNSYTLDSSQRNYSRAEHPMSYTLDRLPPNTYKERRVSTCSANYPSVNTYTNSHPNLNMYHNQYSHTLPPNVHLISHSPQQVHYQTPALSQPNLNYPQNVHISPIRSKTLDHDPRRGVPDGHNGYTDYTYQQQYILNQHLAHTPPMHSPLNHITMGHNRTSPVVSHITHSPLMHHTSPVAHVAPYVQETDYSNMNTNSLYESEMLSTGLGGYWYKNENNESIWVPTVSPLSPTHWTRDKRFGSLDRRKEKYIHNKHIENRKPEHVQTLPYQPRSTSSQDKPLVRTQSLGSVGAQTIDIPWPDDNSSCDSDGHSIKERSSSRKSKPKGWCETSLDTPTFSENSQHEENYPPRIYSTPQTPKLLEIPAESNPSPSQPDVNTELFNNNALMDLPKNCTVVQAGQYKPYREVTKPFEMEDFYKYSTKFREKKVKDNENDVRNQEEKERKNRDYENVEQEVPGMVQKSIYQPLQPMKCQPYGPPK